MIGAPGVNALWNSSGRCRLVFSRTRKCAIRQAKCQDERARPRAYSNAFWRPYTAQSFRQSCACGLISSARHCQASSATGTRTRVARVRAEYPSQLDYSGFWQPCAIQRFGQGWACGVASVPSVFRAYCATWARAPGASVGLIFRAFPALVFARCRPCGRVCFLAPTSPLPFLGAPPSPVHGFSRCHLCSRRAFPDDPALEHSPSPVPSVRPASQGEFSDSPAL